MGLYSNPKQNLFLAVCPTHRHRFQFWGKTLDCCVASQVFCCDDFSGMPCVLSSFLKPRWTHFLWWCHLLTKITLSKTRHTTITLKLGHFYINSNCKFDLPLRDRWQKLPPPSHWHPQYTLICTGTPRYSVNISESIVLFRSWQFCSFSKFKNAVQAKQQSANAVKDYGIFDLSEKIVMDCIWLFRRIDCSIS